MSQETTPAEKAEHFRRGRNMMGMFAAFPLLMALSGFSSMPQRESEYKLQQDFFRAAVQDQISDHTALTYKNATDQALEKARVGDLTAVIPFNASGTVDLSKIAPAVEEKRNKYDEELNIKRTAIGMQAGLMGMMGLWFISMAARSHREMKRWQAGGPSNPSP